MPSFSYSAVASNGRNAAGVIDAPDKPGAIARLAERGEFVTEIAPAAATTRTPAPAESTPGAAGTGRVRPRERVTLLNQLAVGLNAGLPLISALRVVEEQAESNAVRGLVSRLAEAVTSGQALSEAMASERRTFDTMQVSMVRAGETAGVLDEIMASLAGFAERDLELREKLRAAAIYPLMVVGLGFLSILVILIFILPRIMSVVGETGAALPLPTRILMGITDTLRSPMGVGLGVLSVAAAAAWWRWSRTPGGTLWIDALKLKLPLIGPATRRVAVSRFARTLGTLSGAGVRITEALPIVRDTLGNEALARHVDHAAHAIARGAGIADELKDSGQFPPMLIQVIAMGEKTGRLDELLMQTATSYDKETAAALQRVMAVVPVLFILALALVVAFILAAALLPIIGMDLGG